ncbi:nuclear transport factor 2 family protein [Larkinella soli]|uniref:nuclear transport factor 2 family protein n=1 Tax=Larkinella soli TaxID=1770527 RepID=UPI0013E357B8|nr:nuclear transport factor 2 family protein [Larkinella soli]
MNALKHGLLFSALLLLPFLPTGVLAQTTPAEDDRIRETLMNYLDGGTFGDTTRLNRAFHPSASMKLVDFTNGRFRDVPIAEYLNNAKKGAGKKADRTTRIVRYEYAGTAGQARVEIDYPTFRFIDFFNLLKIDGEWKIVSKITYRQEFAK